MALPRHYRITPLALAPLLLTQLALACCGERDESKLVESLTSGEAAARQEAEQRAEQAVERGEPRAFVARGVTLDVPPSWTQTPPANSFRIAQLVLPSGAEIIVSGGIQGSIEGNIARWEGQVTGGSPQRTTIARGDFTIHAIESTGTYASGLPSDPGERPNHTLLGAIIEGGPEGLLFVKLVAPASDVTDDVRVRFANMLASVR